MARRPNGNNTNETNDAFVVEQDVGNVGYTAHQVKPTIAKGKSHAMENSSDIAPNMLPSDYRPSESEEFMNPMQLLYFRRKLEAWKAELLDDASETITGLSQENLHLCHSSNYFFYFLFLAVPINQVLHFSRRQPQYE